MTAITVGTTMRPGSSSIDKRVVELPLGDAQGITLMPGQAAWVWESSLCCLILPVFWPVLVINEDGQLRKYVLGIGEFRAAVR